MTKVIQRMVHFAQVEFVVVRRVKYHLREYSSQQLRYAQQLNQVNALLQRGIHDEIST